MTSAYQFLRFRVRLLEDLHSGSGLGRIGFVDDLHAKDRQGRPVLWSSALNGLLRNEADVLFSLNDPGAAVLERIRRIFGREGEDGRGALCARSLHFARDPDAPAALDPLFLLAGQAAREAGSRWPLDQTLRVVEHAAAGLVAEGELRIQGAGPHAPEDFQFLKRCLTRLQSVGGGKTRGLGRIFLEEMEVGEIPVPAVPVFQPTTPGTLRLLLRNLEPLCFPLTGVPGNILRSETYVPGSALRGALLNALNEQNGPSSFAAIDGLAAPGGLRVTNAYPVPPQVYCELPQDPERSTTFCVVPLPLSGQQHSGKDRRVHLPGPPWWSAPSRSARFWLQDPRMERDLLDDSAAGGGSFERVKQDTYLYTLDACRWQRWAPSMMTMLHNRTPVRRVDRRVDSRRRAVLSERAWMDDEGELFAETSLAEEQFFAADLHFDRSSGAEVFARLAGALLSRKSEERRWLRLGRGGRPAEIVFWQWMPLDEETERAAPEAEKMTLTLTSDWLVRGENLNFLGRLTPEELVRLAGCTASGQELTIEPKKCFLESRLVHGFSTAAGSRRLAALAIKKGSCFQVRAPEQNPLARERWKDLYCKLAALQARHGALGERTEEGFGRFLLDCSVHQRPAGAEAPPQASGASAAVDTTPREEVLKYILASAGPALEQAHKRSAEAFPPRSQWQRLRSNAEHLSGGAEEFLTAVAAVAGELVRTARGKEKRELKVGEVGLEEWLKTELEKWSTLDQKRDFLTFLVRWIVQIQAPKAEGQDHE